MSFLTLDNVSHYFFNKKGFTKALDRISLNIEEGEFVSILGPSGCGKSTILSIVSGLIKQTEGDVLYKQQTPSNIGYMLQQDYLFPWKTIIDNVLIGPKINHTHSKSMKTKGIELLNEVGLAKVINAYPDSLSGGMRQRAALVRTLITNPDILLLDEPFSALDYLTKLKLENLVAELLKTYRKTSILVTHDIGEAIAMTDRVILMDTHPGKINHIFKVPIELRNEKPFLVRRHPKYQIIFDKIWSKVNETDSEGGDALI